MSKTYQNSKDWQKLVFQNAKVLRNIRTYKLGRGFLYFHSKLSYSRAQTKSSWSLTFLVNFFYISIQKFFFLHIFAQKRSQLCKDSNNFPHIQFSHLPQELFKERPPSNILEAADNRALICTFEWLSPHLDVIGWLKTSLFSLPGWTQTTSELAKNLWW